MNYSRTKGRIRGLNSPRRNNYFYGKLLDVPHFQMEQDYFNEQRRMLNRLTIGTGVVCGLIVQARGELVCVSQGVAIDTLGREIIVPETACIDPWAITDNCTPQSQPLPKNVPQKVYLCLAYNECAADYMPLMVSDCSTDDQSSPGTIVESFCLMVHRGQPDDIVDNEALCRALTASGTSKQERRQLITEVLLEKSCFTAGGSSGGSSCVPLAEIDLLENGSIGTINMLSRRPMVYSNAVLFDLIMCLSERIEECCNPTTPPILKSLHYVSGDNQTAPVGSPVTDDLVVEVRHNGVPFDGEPVTFTIRSGGGQIGKDSASLSVNPVIVDTALGGKAPLKKWILGATGSNEVVASIADGNTTQMLSFHAKVTEVVKTLEIVSGNNQHAAENTPVPASLVVLVRENGQAKEGELVSFIVTNNGGPIGESLSTANSNDFVATSAHDGTASLPYWKLGAYDEINIVAANGANTTPDKVVFEATATEVLKIIAVEFLPTIAAPVISLIDPTTPLQFKGASRVNAIRFTFNHAVDPNTVNLNSIQIENRTTVSTLMNGRLTISPPNPPDLSAAQTVTFTLPDGWFRKGKYNVQVWGDDNPNLPRPSLPIQSASSSVRLDGDTNPSLPSGDDHEGGLFKFDFEVF